MIQPATGLADPTAGTSKGGTAGDDMAADEEGSELANEGTGEDTPREKYMEPSIVETADNISIEIMERVAAEARKKGERERDGEERQVQEKTGGGRAEEACLQQGRQEAHSRWQPRPRPMQCQQIGPWQPPWQRSHRL